MTLASPIPVSVGQNMTKCMDRKLVCRLIDCPMQWQAVSESWDRIFRGPMQSYSWLTAWWKHFHSHNQSRLAIIAVSVEDEDVAYLPTLIQKNNLGNTLKLLGSGEVCSDYLDVGIDSQLTDDQRTQVITSLVKFLRSRNLESQIGTLDCLEFEGYSDLQTNLIQLIQQLNETTASTETVPLEGCWITKFAETWNAYELSISKSRRRKVRKALKWEAEGKLAWRKCDSREKILKVWPDVVRLHQQRRQMLGQPGCFAESEFESFLLEAMTELAEQGRAFVAVLENVEQEKQAIAVVLLLEADDCWQIYQSGADPDAMSWEPGHSLNSLILKDNFDHGPQVVDFLRGDEPYKEGWSADRIGLYRTRIFGKHLSARLRFQALRARRQWKQWSGQIKSKFWTGAEK